jgi:hypothetical protein
MMKRFLLVVSTAALLYPAAAAAKSVQGVELCGSDGCQSKQTTDAALFAEGGNGPFAGLGGIVQPAKPSPWYRGALLLGEKGKVFGRIRFFYVPGANLLVQPGDGNEQPAWWPGQPNLRKIVAALAARVTPFDPPRDVRVSVDGRQVVDPRSYLRLYTIGARTDRFPTEEEGVGLSFTSRTATPWTTGNYMVLYPKSHLLIRDGQMVAVSPTISDRVVRGASLDGGGSRWLIAALMGAVLAAALSALAVVVRRARPAPRPVPQS